jgi:ribosomal protein S15P/S13E
MESKYRLKELNSKQISMHLKAQKKDYATHYKTQLIISQTQGLCNDRKNWALSFMI